MFPIGSSRFLEKRLLLSRPEVEPPEAGIDRIEELIAGVGFRIKIINDVCVINFLAYILKTELRFEKKTICSAGLLAINSHQINTPSMIMVFNYH